MIDSSDGTIKLGAPNFSSLIRGDIYPLSAPEIHKGFGEIKSDVWSLGLTLIEMATGVEAYNDIASPVQKTIALLNGNLPNALSDVSDPHVADFISNCLLPIDQRPSVIQLQEFALITDFDSKSPTKNFTLSMHLSFQTFGDSLSYLMEDQEKEVDTLKKKQQEQGKL